MAERMTAIFDTNLKQTELIISYVDFHHMARVLKTKPVTLLRNLPECCHRGPYKVIQE